MVLLLGEPQGIQNITQHTIGSVHVCVCPLVFAPLLIKDPHHQDAMLVILSNPTSQVHL